MALSLTGDDTVSIKATTVSPLTVSTATCKSDTLVTCAVTFVGLSEVSRALPLRVLPVAVSTPL